MPYSQKERDVSKPIWSWIDLSFYFLTLTWLLKNLNRFWITVILKLQILELIDSNSLSRYIKIRYHPLLAITRLYTKSICCDCDYSYVNQTSRQLKTHIFEYCNRIYWNCMLNSVITDHRIDYEYDWNDVQIIESCYTRRLISKMINIKRQKFSVQKFTKWHRTLQSFLLSYHQFLRNFKFTAIICICMWPFSLYLKLWALLCHP